MIFTYKMEVWIKQLIIKVIPAKISELLVDLLKQFTSFKSINLRNNTTDKIVFFNVVLLSELKMPFTITPKIIIDAGAYTGISTTYYAIKYPNAMIIAIEPEKDNYNLLVKNCVSFNNVVTLNSGLWSHNTQLEVIDSGTGAWGWMVQENIDRGDVRGVSLISIMNNFSLQTIDILKLDIEGSEKVIFDSDSHEWLEHTNVILIELHERKVPGCEWAVWQALNNKNWKRYSSVDKTIYMRRSFLFNE